MFRIILILFLIIPALSFADDNPRGSDDKGGKLDDLENAKGGSDDSFLIYLLVDVIVRSPEILFGSSTTYSYSEFPYQNFTGIYEENNDKLWRFNADLAYLKESSSLNAVNLDASLSPSRYWSVKGKYFRFTENVNFEKSNLDISQLFIQYHRVRRERFNLEWGLGYVAMTGKNYRSGAGLNVGAELFFFKPFSLESNYILAYIDNGIFDEFDAKFNFYHKRFNVFAGYKYISVANISLNNIMLGIGVNF